MSQPSLANFIVKRPWLRRWMEPLASWYVDNAGYRKLGLRYEQTLINIAYFNSFKLEWLLAACKC